MTELRTMYADLHIHIGRTEAGNPVKISGSRDLTFYNIAREASERKGIHITGIIDCHSPAVQEEIERYLENGSMTELHGGGIRYGETTVLLGSELEVKDPGRGPAHLLIFLPKLSAMKDFTSWLAPRMKNVHLSSQRVYVTARELQEEAGFRAGRLTKLAEFYSAPGFCTEKLHLFAAEELTPSRLPMDEDEQIELVRVSLDEAVRMALAGELRDAKTLAGVLLYARLRGR